MTRADLLNVDDLCALLRLSRSTVNDMCKRGQIPAKKLVVTGAPDSVQTYQYPSQGLCGVRTTASTGAWDWKLVTCEPCLKLKPAGT